MKTFWKTFLAIVLALSLLPMAAACGEQELPDNQDQNGQVTPEPDEPSTPDTPNTPDTPDEPSTPDTPDAPSTPDTPDVPDKPSTPDEPVTPEEPDEPYIPQQPEDFDPSNPDPNDPDEKGAFDGNDEQTKSYVDYFNQVYLPYYTNCSAIANAAKVKREVAVKSGTLTVYSVEQIYTKQDGGYAVEETERTLNDLGGDKAFEEKTSSRTEQEVKGLFGPNDIKLTDFLELPMYDASGTFGGKIKRSSAMRLFEFTTTKKITNIDLLFLVNLNSMNYVTVNGYTLTFEAGDYTIELTLSVM